MDICNYLRFRANETGAPFTLSVSFFLFWLELGTRNFYDCEVDSRGVVLSDTRNPGCLQRYWFSKFQAYRRGSF